MGKSKVMVFAEGGPVRGVYREFIWNRCSHLNILGLLCNVG